MSEERGTDEETRPGPEIAYPRPGYIYCISNPSMPGKVKVGMTTHHPMERLRSLDTTGVPTPFELDAWWLTEDVLRDEARAHRALERARTRLAREFFDIDAGRAVPRIANALGARPGGRIEAAAARTGGPLTEREMFWTLSFALFFGAAVMAARGQDPAYALLLWGLCASVALFRRRPGRRGSRGPLSRS